MEQISLAIGVCVFCFLFVCDFFVLVWFCFLSSVSKVLMCSVPSSGRN